MPSRPTSASGAFDPREHRRTRLDRPHRLPGGDHGYRPRCRISRPQERRLFSRRPPIRAVADGRSELRRRHTRRNAGLARRRGVLARRLGHLVSVEEPLCHPLLLDHGAGVPPDSPHDDGGADRGSVRLVDGGHLHRVRAVLLHHQHRQHAQGRRQSHQPGHRRHRRRQRDCRRDDGDVRPLQLRGWTGRGGVDRSVSGRPDHRPLVHADSARMGRRGRAARHEGLARAVQVLARDPFGRRAVGDCRT